MWLFAKQWNHIFEKSTKTTCQMLKMKSQKSQERGKKKLWNANNRVLTLVYISWILVFEFLSCYFPLLIEGFVHSGLEFHFPCLPPLLLPSRILSHLRTVTHLALQCFPHVQWKEFGDFINNYQRIRKSEENFFIQGTSLKTTIGWVWSLRWQQAQFL